MAPIVVNIDAEQEAFDKEVASIEEWWKTPRQASIKRQVHAFRKTNSFQLFLQIHNF